MNRFGWPAGLAAGVVVSLATGAAADLFDFTISLDGGQEVPPNGSAATGVGAMSYDDATNLFSLDIVVDGIMTADLLGSHIHLGVFGSNGPIIVNLADHGTWMDGGSGMSITITDAPFPPEHDAALKADGTYVNIHTPTFPAGEIRGQVLLEAPGCKGKPFAGQINEIRTDQPSTDNDEYFELVGDPGSCLDGVFYIVVGDGDGGSGSVEAIVDLAGFAINANGFFLAVEETFTIGAVTPDLTLAGNGLNFENSDNVTHMIVRDLNPAIHLGGGFGGSDLDVDDDGVIDPTGDYDGDGNDDGAPFSAILDDVALIEEIGGGDLVYSTNVVGPDGPFVPAQVFRCPGGEFFGWEIGQFDPVGGDDTPGEANVCAGPCVAELTNAEVTFGSNVGPVDVAKLGEDDNDRAIASSKVFLSALEPNLAVLEVTGDFSACLGPGPEVTIDIQDQASQPNVTARIRLVPGGGGSAVQVDQYAVTFNVDQDHQTVVANGGDFINANSEIIMEIRYSTIALLSPLGFDGRTDKVAFSAN